MDLVPHLVLYIGTGSDNCPFPISVYCNIEGDLVSLFFCHDAYLGKIHTLGDGIQRYDREREWNKTRQKRQELYACGQSYFDD